MSSVLSLQKRCLFIGKAVHSFASDEEHDDVVRLTERRSFPRNSAIELDAVRIDATFHNRNAST